jgi:hypothetical protein
MMPIVTVEQDCMNYALHNNCIKPKMEIHPIKTFLSLLLAIIILPLISACATPSQILADAEVKRLCEKDGGIKVYETVTLPADRYDQYIRGIKSKNYIRHTDEYYLDGKSTTLKPGYARIIRNKYQIIRVRDEKVMGESVRYSRSGGDIPGSWHGTSYSCPESPLKLIRSIFLKEE